MTPSATPTPMPAFAPVLSPVFDADPEYVDEGDADMAAEDVEVGLLIVELEDVGVAPMVAASTNFDTEGLLQQLAASSAPQHQFPSLETSVQFWTV